jgi:hypothetical protein
MEWVEAWFALDSLMHRTCHASATVLQLRSEGRDSEITPLLERLKEEHTLWRERPVVKISEESEQIELLMKFNIDTPSPSSNPASPPSLQGSSFLSYPPMRVVDYFLGSRLNNWRAINLYLSLIEQPQWGAHDGTRILCAIDLCRTHAALGAERNFLGAEKSVGLYLAGVSFGGQQMYAVITTMSKLILERIGVGYRAT